MADKQTTAYCYVCGKQSRYVKPRINHVLHLILTIFTVGVWGIVWLILGISNSSKPLRCVTCGTSKGSGKRAAQMAAAQGVGAAGTATAAGWYPDPEDSSRRRYWDGATWTDHFDPPLPTPAGRAPEVLAAGPESPDASPSPPAEAAEPPPMPAPIEAPSADVPQSADDLSEPVAEPATVFCEQCGSPMAVDSDSCPECGHEPSARGTTPEAGAGES